MKQFIRRRVVYSLLSLFLLSLTIFFFVRVTGDPAALLVEPGASEADIAAIHHQFGLDRPLWVQYGIFMSSLFHGDLGQSFYYRMPVMDLYLSRLPNSLILAAVAMGLSLLIGIPSGILASVRVGRFWDNAGKLFALLGLSLPSFWVGLVMILVFSVYLGWLPSSGSGTPLHLIMPAFALGWYFAASHMRLTRSSMLEVLGSEYIKLARIKGLPESLVIAKHAFKNALIPVLTLAGINLVIMVNVAVVVETVFAWPGIGRLLYEGIAFRDFPVVQGVVLLGGAMIVDRQSGGRRPLCGDRSPDPSGEVTAMSTQADTIVLPSRSRWRPRAIRLGDFPLVPVLILAGVAFVAIFANVLAPHNPEVGSLAARFKPPFWQTGGSAKFLLGTDQLGRDVLSRLIFGARVSMIVGFTAVIFAGVIGTALGIVSGYIGGWVDQVIMRLTDTWLALPALTFAIFLAAIVGPSMWNIVIILGITYWTRYARVIRGEVLSLKEREFVRLAIVAGCSQWSIMFRHILPNVLNSAIVLGTLMLGVVIITEATLSFLGVGVPPPQPAWGLMLADGKQGLMVGYWWLTVLPGLCIMLMVLSANLIGDWLRVKFDPQLRQL